MKTALLRIGCAVCVGIGALAIVQAQETKPIASPPAQTSQTVNGKTVSINYGAPSMRGRNIFGGLVPYDKVWRTGANAATTLKTEANLKIGGATVPAGTYTLYTLPSQGTWKLIINKQTGQWGTVYDEAQDLVRVDMQKSQTQQPIEQFTISFNKTSDTSADLVLEWENARLSVPVKAK